MVNFLIGSQTEFWIDIFPPENFGSDIFKTVFWQSPPSTRTQKTFKAVWLGKYIYTLYIYIYTLITLYCFSGTLPKDFRIANYI